MKVFLHIAIPFHIIATLRLRSVRHTAYTINGKARDETMREIEGFGYKFEKVASLCRSPAIFH